jgi:hypothetical protein
VLAKTERLLFDFQLAFRELGDSHREALQRVVCTSFFHQKRERHDIRLLSVGFVIGLLVVVELDRFDSVASDQHVDFGGRTEDSFFCKVVNDSVYVSLPLGLTSKLLVFHERKLVVRKVSENRINRELVFEVHCERFLLERKPAEHFFVALNYQFV